MGSILDKLFKAKTAKQLVKKYLSNGLNYQRSTVLYMIKGASLNGKSSIVIDNAGIKLNDEDYDFFRNLGYKVDPESIIKYCTIKDKLEYCNHRFGIISWED